MATTDQLLIEIKASTQKLEQSLSRVEGKLKHTKRESQGLKNSLKGVTSILATLGGVALLGNITNTIRKFEDLEATLVAVTGSAGAAAASFDLVRKFTSQTTFQIEEVAQAFITLKNAGITPTSDVMRDFGNLSAGMGRSITQLAQAAFNATTGEMEMLKQFGIIARVEGDKLRVTFKGRSELIERDADSIIQKIRSIGATEFSTGIESRFDTLSGAISNLGDATSEFFVSIGDGGLKDALTDITRATTALLTDAKPLAEILGGALGIAVRTLGASIKLVVDNLDILASLLAGIIALNMGAIITSIGATLNTLLNTLRGIAITATLIFSLSGIGLRQVAVAGTAATATFLTLNSLLKDSADDTEDLKEADEKLVKELNEVASATTFLDMKMQGLAKSMRELERDEPSLHELVREFESLEDALFDIGNDFDDFFEKRLQQMKNSFVGPFRDISEVLGTDLETFMANLEDEFFQLNFNMDKDTFKRNFSLALIDGAHEALGDVQNFMKEQDDPFGTKALNEILADDTGVLLGKFFTEGQAQGLFFGKTIDQVKKGIEEYVAVAETAEETDPFKNLKGLDKAIVDASQDVAFGVDAIKAELEGLTDEQLLERINSLGIDFEELGIKAEDVVPVMRELTATSDDLNDLLEDLEPTIENIAEAFELINTALADGDISLETAVAAYRRFLRATGPVGEAMAEIGQEVESAATALSDELVDALLEGEDALDAFDNFAKKVVQSVISSFMDLLVIQPIVDAILGAFKIPNSSGSGVVGENASGGAVYNGQPTIVGERGPELFVPYSHGKIVNAHNTRGMGGGTVVVNQSINFATGIVPTVRAEVMGMLPQIAEVTKSAVADEAQRGGNFKRMLVGRS